MATRLSQGAIIAICASVGSLSLAVGCFVVIKYLRQKHNRLSQLRSETIERRLSGYSGGHFNFTDTDFARTPGTRTKLRRSINNPYSRPRDWASIPSCENLERRPTILRNPKALVADEIEPDPSPKSRKWPVPPRLKRTNAIPLSTIRAPASIQIIERPVKHAEKTPNRAKILGPVPRPVEKHTEQHTDTIAGPVYGVPGLISPEAVARPRPLFYGKQRSNSTGVVGQGSKWNGMHAPVDIPQATQTQAGSLLARKPSLPRSVSLFTQQPGQAPSIPMPKLPSDVSTRIQKIKHPTDKGSKRPSSISLVSEHTSVMDDSASRTFSQTDTELTSISLLSPTASNFAPVGLGIDFDSGRWDKNSTFLETDGLHTQMGSQQSLGASIQHSLPRDNSSGLRFSMYDHNQFHHESSTTLSKDVSPKLNLRAPSSADRRSLGQHGLPPALPSGTGVDSKNYEGLHNKRASTAGFKDVSGNEGSPLKWESRPASTANIDQFHFDTHVFVPQNYPSDTKDSVKRDNQEKCPHTSNFSAAFSSGSDIPSENKELETARVDLPIPGLFNQAISRPPSKATFSPKIFPSCQRQAAAIKIEKVDSPTLSMMKVYKHGDNSSSDSIASTPTRKPSGRDPSTFRPRNNRKSTFLGLKTYEPESAPNLPTFPNLAIADLSSNHPEISPHSSKRSSLQFPDPPKSLNRASWRQAPLYGPRTPPRRFRSRACRSPTRQPLTRRSPSQSPIGVGIGKYSISHSPSPRSKQLLSSIMNLRRMNSEVSESGGERAHRRFRSLGSAENAIEEREGGREERGGAPAIQRVSEGVSTPRYLPEIEIPGLEFSSVKMEDDIWDTPRWSVAESNHHGDELYGADGFLRD